MNVPAILKLAEEYREKNNSLNAPWAEALAHRSKLLMLTETLNSHKNRLELVQKGEASPSLESSRLAETAANIAVSETMLFFRCLDIVCILQNMNVKHECLNM